MKLHELQAARDGLWQQVMAISLAEMGIVARPQYHELRKAASIAHSSALNAGEDAVRLCALQEAWDARYGPDGEPT